MPRLAVPESRRTISGAMPNPGLCRIDSRISRLARSWGVCGPERFGMIGEGYRLFRNARSSSSGR